MIRFPCRCGQTMNVPDDAAGSDLQCPLCGLLNTVPTLGDVARIDADGTYKIDADAPTGTPSEARLETLRRAFTRNTVDADGTEIDLRSTADELRLAGDIPFADDGADARPRYDPASGERIRPLPIKPDDRPAADDIPMAQAAITYAAAPPRAHNLAGAMALLVSPGNLAVLGFIFLMHLVVLGTVALAVGMGFYTVAVVGIALVFGMTGHYANVIEEVGPRDMDELPRPFRDVQFGEDLWWPFVNVLMTLTICVGPAAWVAFGLDAPVAVRTIAMAAALAFAVVALPAVGLTVVAGGTILNLRPDRVVSVMRAGGASYAFLCLTWLAAAAAYLTALVGTTSMMVGAFGTGGRAWYARPAIAYPLLCVGVYLIHVFCWHAGLYYREHHAKFAWLFQRHVRTSKREGVAARQARRATQKHEREARRELDRTTNDFGTW